MPITRVTAFVDWNSQLRLTKIDLASHPEHAAESALKKTARRIAVCLSGSNAQDRFRVHLRLYHGWHKGFEPTVNRKAIQRVVARTDFATLSSRPSVVISPDIAFGDRLAYALDRRLHTHLGIHLPNTLRGRGKREIEEKMVDTALAADLVTIAHQYPSEWIVVVTEDDDMIPPIFVAEAILSTTGSRVFMLRKRTQKSMLILEDVLESD